MRRFIDTILGLPCRLQIVGGWVLAIGAAILCGMFTGLALRLGSMLLVIVSLCVLGLLWAVSAALLAVGTFQLLRRWLPRSAASVLTVALLGVQVYVGYKVLLPISVVLCFVVMPPI